MRDLTQGRVSSKIPELLGNSLCSFPFSVEMTVLGHMKDPGSLEAGHRQSFIS